MMPSYAGLRRAYQRSSFPKLLRPVRRSVNLWLDADGLRMSAAMSFYGILSLAPLLVLLMWIYFSSAVLLLSASVARALSDEAELRKAASAPV